MPTQKLDSEDRLEQRYRKLGSRNPVCVCCGYDDPHALELHHIAGQKHDDDLSIVCRNCHRRLSDQQLDHPEDLPVQETSLATIGHYLMGLADLFRMLADRLVEFGKHLIELANGSGDIQPGEKP